MKAKMMMQDSTRHGGRRVSGLAGWPAVAILLLLCTVSFLDRQVISLMVDPIRRDLGISDFEISMLHGLAFGAFYAIFGFPIGWLVDRVSRRWAIFGGVTIWSLAASACGFAQNWLQLFIGRLGVGVGEAALSPAAYSLIADMFPPQRLALAIAVFALGATIGTAAAVAIGGWVIAAFGDATIVHLPFIGDVRPWQAVFIVTGLPGLLLGFAAFALHEPPRRTRPAQAGARSFAELFAFLRSRWRLFFCHFVGFGCLSMIGYGVGAWTPSYLIRHFGWNPGDVGGALAIVLLAGAIPGGLFGGFMVDRMFASGRTDAHLRYFAFAMIVPLTIGIGAFFVADAIWFLVLMTLLQFVLPFSGVASAALQIVTPSHMRGQISALYLFVFNMMGLGLGPLVVAGFTDFVFKDSAAVGYAIVSSIALLAPIAGILFILGMKPLREAVEAAKSLS